MAVLVVLLGVAMATRAPSDSGSAQTQATAVAAAAAATAQSASTPATRPTAAQPTQAAAARAAVQPTQPVPASSATNAAPAPAGAPTRPAAAVPTRAAPTPVPINYADELTDFGVPPQTVLQTEDRIGTATPDSIPGGDTVTTTELASVLSRQPRPELVLIDALAGPAHSTIPGALSVPDAGDAGSLNDSTERDLASYYRSLTDNDLTTVLVFFCQGAHCWESYNASLRAINMGYTNVYWYRGGLSAWQAAGLPLTP